MRVWVTRAEPGAARTAERLRVLGHDPLVVPLLQVRALPAVSVDLDGVGALAFTSANGVAAFAALCPERGLPVFAVGAATAAAAREAGFAEVRSADGDVAALAALIAAERARFSGQVLAPGARRPAGELAGARALPVYETVALPAPAALAALGGLDAVLVHSPRGGERLAEVLAGCDVSRLAALCISPAAVAPLTGLPFGRLAWAEQPDEASLLALL